MTNAEKPNPFDAPAPQAPTQPLSIWRSEEDENRIPDSTAIAIAAGVPLGLVIFVCSGCGGLFALGQEDNDAGGAAMAAGLCLMALFAVGVVSFAMALNGKLPRLFWGLMIAAICGCLVIFLMLWLSEGGL